MTIAWSQTSSETLAPSPIIWRCLQRSARVAVGLVALGLVVVGWWWRVGGGPSST